jgi:nitrilase
MVQQNIVRAAVVQLTPIFLDNKATLAKIESVLQKLKKQDCQLALFPESLLPGYPRGFNFGATIGRRTEAGRELWLKYYRASVLPGDEVCHTLGTLSKKYEVYLVIGVTERDAVNGSLYCSMFYFDQQGDLVAKHRKIKPTASERIIWAEGDGSSIKSITTSLGRIGGLICWENYMPQARMRLYQTGIDIYLAPTADARVTWQSSMQHIACEGRTFVLSSNQFFRQEDYDQSFRELLENDQPDILCRGGSVIVSPYGQVIAGPLYDQEGFLIADLDMSEVTKSRMDFDPIGHYARNDLFSDP